MYIPDKVRIVWRDNGRVQSVVSADPGHEDDKLNVQEVQVRLTPLEVSVRVEYGYITGANIRHLETTSRVYASDEVILDIQHNLPVAHTKE